MLNFIYFVSWILILLFLVLSTAFSTLLERKLLSLSQNRIGPNKTALHGILQPVLDGMKLFLKATVQLESLHKVMYKIVPFFSFLISFFLFLILPMQIFTNNYYQAFWVLVVFGLNSHLLLIAGWSSQNKYGMIGSIRNLSQTISFEILLSLMIFFPFLLNGGLNWNSFFSCSLLIMMWIWVVVLMMENQRAPFDLSESESELVSGFNTEFSGLFFTYFFLAEYGNLLVTASFTHLIWIDWNSGLLFWILLWLMLRSCYPRFRFDHIMSFSWMSLLPAVLLIWLGFVTSSFI